MKFLERFREWINGSAEEKDQGKGRGGSRSQLWGILLIIGLLLAVIAWPVKDKDKEGGSAYSDRLLAEQDAFLSSQPTSNLTYEEQLEKKLAEMLSGVKGAGRVKVMITLESSSELVLQTDEQKNTDMLHEEDSEGGVRDSSQSSYEKSTVQIGSGDAPYVIKEINPKISGVLIVAEGASSAAVKSEISAAVEALFGLPLHKIKVLEAE